MTTPVMTKPNASPMSPEHKEALARGRREGAAVRDYLNALDAHKPKRGRQRTRDSVERQLARTIESIGDADPFDRLQLVQDRMDLEAELTEMDKQEGADLAELEEAFVEVAKSYADRKGISNGAFRTLGVPAAVLRAAGVTRS